MKPTPERGAERPDWSCAFAWSERSCWPPQLALAASGLGARLHPACSAHAQLPQVSVATVGPGSAACEEGRARRQVPAERLRIHIYLSRKWKRENEQPKETCSPDEGR